MKIVAYDYVRRIGFRVCGVRGVAGNCTPANLYVDLAAALANDAS